MQQLCLASPVDGTSLVPATSQQVLQNPSLFQTPLDFTSLKEIHTGSNGKLVILMEDAHSNLSGQQSIAGALEDILKRYGITLVMVEGGVDDCTMTPLKKVASASVWKKLAKSFLMQGEISGEEYLNLTSDVPMKILGLEDLSLYLKSVQSYADLTDHRQMNLDHLTEMRDAVQKLKRKMYPEPLVQYESRVYDGGELSSRFDQGLDAIVELAHGLDVDMSDFPDLSKMIALKDQEKLIDFDAAGLEQARILEEISAKDPSGKWRESLSQDRRSARSKLLQISYFQNTLNIAQEKKIDLSRFTNWSAYGRYLEDFGSIDLDQVLQQYTLLEDRVYALTLRSPDEKILRAIDRYLQLLSSAFNIRMTTEEFRAFEENEPDFGTVPMEAFLNSKLAEFGYFADILTYEHRFEMDKGLLKKFYAAVNERDQAFLDNAAKYLDREKQRAAVIISGGYHTPHLKKLLVDQGYSVIVLSPLVTSETNQSRYEKLLLAPLRGEARKVYAVGASRLKPERSLSALDRDLERMMKKKSGGVRTKAALMLNGLSAALNREMRAPEKKAWQSVLGSTRRMIESVNGEEQTDEERLAHLNLLEELDRLAQLLSDKEVIVTSEDETATPSGAQGARMAETQPFATNSRSALDGPALQNVLRNSSSTSFLNQAWDIGYLGRSIFENQPKMVQDAGTTIKVAKSIKDIPLSDNTIVLYWKMDDGKIRFMSIATGGRDVQYGANDSRVGGTNSWAKLNQLHGPELTRLNVWLSGQAINKQAKLDQLNRIIATLDLKPGLDGRPSDMLLPTIQQMGLFFQRDLKPGKTDDGAAKGQVTLQSVWNSMRAAETNFSDRWSNEQVFWRFVYGWIRVREPNMSSDNIAKMTDAEVEKVKIGSRAPVQVVHDNTRMMDGLISEIHPESLIPADKEKAIQDYVKGSTTLADAMQVLSDRDTDLVRASLVSGRASHFFDLNESQRIAVKSAITHAEAKTRLPEVLKENLKTDPVSEDTFSQMIAWLPAEAGWNEPPAASNGARLSAAAQTLMEFLQNEYAVSPTDTSEIDRLILAYLSMRSISLKEHLANLKSVDPKFYDTVFKQEDQRRTSHAMLQWSLAKVAVLHDLTIDQVKELGIIVHSPQTTGISMNELVSEKVGASVPSGQIDDLIRDLRTARQQILEVDGNFRYESQAQMKKLFKIEMALPATATDKDLAERLSKESTEGPGAQTLDFSRLPEESYEVLGLGGEAWVILYNNSVFKIARGEHGTIMSEAAALNELKGLQGIPKLLRVGRDAQGHEWFNISYQRGAYSLANSASAGLGLPDAVEVARQLASIVSEIHRAGWVHGDIKPSNVLVWRDTNGKIQVQLIDLGVARREGELLKGGTPEYLVGVTRESSRETQASFRQDLFALGMTFTDLFIRNDERSNDALKKIRQSELKEYGLDKVLMGLMGPDRGKGTLPEVVERLTEIRGELSPLRSADVDTLIEGIGASSDAGARMASEWLPKLSREEARPFLVLAFKLPSDHLLGEAEVPYMDYLQGNKTLPEVLPSPYDAQERSELAAKLVTARAMANLSWKPWETPEKLRAAQTMAESLEQFLLSSDNAESFENVVNGIMEWSKTDKATSRQVLTAAVNEFKGLNGQPVTAAEPSTDSGARMAEDREKGPLGKMFAIPAQNRVTAIASKDPSKVMLAKVYMTVLQKKGLFAFKMTTGNALLRFEIEGQRVKVFVYSAVEQVDLSEPLMILDITDSLKDTTQEPMTLALPDVNAPEFVRAPVADVSPLILSGADHGLLKDRAEALAELLRLNRFGRSLVSDEKLWKEMGPLFDRQLPQIRIVSLDDVVGPDPSSDEIELTVKEYMEAMAIAQKAGPVSYLFISKKNKGLEERFNKVASERGVAYSGYFDATHVKVSYDMDSKLDDLGRRALKEGLAVALKERGHATLADLVGTKGFAVNVVQRANGAEGLTLPLVAMEVAASIIARLKDVNSTNVPNRVESFLVGLMGLETNSHLLWDNLDKLQNFDPSYDQYELFGIKPIRIAFDQFLEFTKSALKAIGTSA